MNKRERHNDNIYQLLLPSFIGIILCLVMLTGSTFAWYTATSSSYVNTGVAATFEIKEVTATPSGAATVSTESAASGIPAERAANGIWTWDANKLITSANEYTIKVSVDTTTDVGCIIVSYKEDAAAIAAKDTYIQVLKTEAVEKTVEVEADEDANPIEALTKNTEVQHIAEKTFTVQLAQGRTLADIEIRALWGQAAANVATIVNNGTIVVPAVGSTQDAASVAETETQNPQTGTQTPQTDTQSAETPTTPVAPSDSATSNNVVSNGGATASGSAAGADGINNNSTPVVPETQESASEPAAQSEPDAQSEVAEE